MSRFVGLLLLLTLAVVGCHSSRFGPYTAPRVAGRVLAADSGQPLAGVEVQRGFRAKKRRPAEPPKGGEVLIEKAGARTDSQGRFTLASERALTLFRPIGWNMVQLTFQRAGYERFQTNVAFTAVHTNTPAGEPLLNTGDILLRPVPSH
jgi:hypothetical protein